MTKNLLLASIALVAFGVTLAGCDDETHADPALVKSMNDQRRAQTRGAQDKGGPPPGTPGAANTNPYGNPPATK